MLLTNQIEIELLNSFIYLNMFCKSILNFLSDKVIAAYQLSTLFVILSSAFPLGEPVSIIKYDFYYSKFEFPVKAYVD